MQELEAVPAIETQGLVKRFSSKSRSLLGTRRVTNLSQLRSFFSILAGRSERNFVALDSVELNVSQGEVFGLLGQNGAGKTTLIKILSTLILPDAGRALVHGVDVVKSPRNALRIVQTVLAEGAGFERRLSGRQNLELYADLYGVAPGTARRRIDELLDFTGLTDKAEASFNRYSTGMARKLVLCRVLLSDARVLIFDEPTTGLDPGAAVEFRKMLREVLVKEKGKTVMLASHNLFEVEQICDRVALLHKGKMIASGTPAEVRSVVSDRITISIVLERRESVPAQVLEAKLRQIAGVVSLQLVENETSGYLTVRLEGSPDFDYSGLFGLLIRKRLGVRSFESSHPSLEDAFIRLTSEVSH